jgi:flagellar basal-body rod modification protein FlgD
MEIPIGTSIDERLAAIAAENRVEHGELGRDAFMKLLVNQLANQDPLEPLTDHEFVAQLATFSSLEQLENMSETMQASLLMNQSVNNTLATTLIGKRVLAEGSTVQLGEEGDIDFQLELATEADVVILVRDSEGDLVRRLDLGHRQAGDNTVEWDGRDESGDRSEAGQYDLEVLATGTAGEDVAHSLKIRALVEGVRFIDGSGFLMVGETTLPLASVFEIYAEGTR